jgi:hypothetical protein
VSTVEDEALLALLRAIAAGDEPLALRLLAGAPALAKAPLRTGASRTGPSGFFFESIMHYAYAGDTALHLASAAYQAKIANDLLARNASVRAKNRRGAEPLHYAADGDPDSPASQQQAQRVVVELLVEAGADPNAVDKNGVAPLHRAVRSRCLSAVLALLEAGANARGQNGGGSTPLHLAVQNTGKSGSGSVAAHDAQAQIIASLLARGARRTDRDAAGKSVDACAKADWIRELLGSA